jgi:hypothetical protein
MIVQTIVQVLLSTPDVIAICGNRIFPDRIPDGSDFPSVVIQKIGGTGEYTNDGDAGIEDSRLQIDSYSAAGSAAAVALKTAIRKRLSGLHNWRQSGAPCAIESCFVINDASGPALETERAGPRLWRRMLEVRVWNREL